jgi:cysteinyl-tRNA synthetase
MVVDYARHGDEPTVLSRSEIDALRRRPDGTERIVLAYLSVGEAESYRYYWQPQWRFRPPSWLIRENSNWRGNYLVRYWDSSWQQIIFKPKPSLFDRFMEGVGAVPKSYVDRIIDAGFDGVFLDRVDAFDEASKVHPTAEADMMTLVARLSAHAKSRKPGFLVVPQNAEELLQHKAYRDVIDAVAKEDLVFGLKGAEVSNEIEDVQHTSEMLNYLKTDGKPVFIVEYVRSPEKREAAVRQVAPLGFILQFANRLLNLPPEPPPGTR